MPGTISYQNRFPLPDDWNVDEFICCVVPLPNDPQYISTFRGLLETLTWQRSFMLHPTEMAAHQVSKTWEAAFASRELKFIRCEDIDMTFDIRVKPGVPWVTEASTDGGLTWHTAIIQPNWSGSNYVSPPIPDEEAALDMSAGFFRHYWEFISQAIATGIDGELGKDATVNGIMDSLTPYGAGASVREALNHAFDEFEVLSPEEQENYTTDCAYDGCFHDLADYMQTHTNWLDGLNDWLVNELNCSSDALMDWLNKSAAYLGSIPLNNFVANNGGGGGGAGFAATCGEHVDYGGHTYRITGANHFDLTVEAGVFIGSVWCGYEFPVVDGEIVEAVVMRFAIEGDQDPYRYVGFTADLGDCVESEDETIIIESEAVTPTDYDDNVPYWYGRRRATGALEEATDMAAFIALTSLGTLDFNLLGSFTASVTGPNIASLGVAHTHSQVGGPTPTATIAHIDSYVIIRTDYVP